MEDGAVSVRVAVRLRPLNAREANDKECVSIHDNAVRINDKQFTYDYCFPTTTKQVDVFNTVASPLLDSFFTGYNATILAYGQTGSGKTFTMGSASTTGVPDESAGIISRVIRRIFEFVADSAADKEVTVKCTFIEIYNDEIRDLLDPSASRRVSVREEKGEGVVLVGAAEQHVHTASELASQLDRGALNRVTHATSMNDVSSRSHAIFSVHLEQKSKHARDDDGDDQIDDYTASKFHFVDLAGSERIKKTGAEGDRMKEGIAINSELLALGNVISALGDPNRQQSHVPYRDSKLTRILQDSLGGNSRTVMVACVSPADSNFFESLSTLRYANRARNIKNKPVINRDPLNALIRSLREEIKTLKAQLLAKDVDGGAPQLDLPSTGSPEQAETIATLKKQLNAAHAVRDSLTAEVEGERARNLQLALRLEQSEDLRKQCVVQMKEAGHDVDERLLVSVVGEGADGVGSVVEAKLSELKRQLDEVTGERDRLNETLRIVKRMLTRKQLKRLQAKEEKLGQRLQKGLSQQEVEAVEGEPADTPAAAEANGEHEHDNDNDSDDEFLHAEEEHQHKHAKKVLEQHYEALSDGIALKEGLVKHVAEKAIEYGNIGDDIGKQIETTQAAIKEAERDMEQVEEKLKVPELAEEEQGELGQRKRNAEALLRKLQAKTTELEREKERLLKIKESNDRKVSELEKELGMMKKQRAHLNQRMREETKAWQQFKEEQRKLVSDLNRKVDHSLKQAEEAKRSEAAVKEELRKTRSELQSRLVPNSGRARKPASSSPRPATSPRPSSSPRPAPAPKRAPSSPLTSARGGEGGGGGGGKGGKTTKRKATLPTTKKGHRSTRSLNVVPQAVVLWKAWLEDGVDRVVELRLAEAKVGRSRRQCELLEDKLNLLKDHIAQTLNAGYVIEETTAEQLEYIEEELEYRLGNVAEQEALIREYELTAPREPVAISKLDVDEARAVCRELWEAVVAEKVYREADLMEVARLNDDLAQCQEEVEQLKLGRPIEQLMLEEQKIQMQKEHEQQLWFFMNKVEGLKAQMTAMQQQSLQPHGDGGDVHEQVRQVLRDNPDLLWEEIDELHEARERRFEDVQEQNELLSDQVTLLSTQLVERLADLQALRRVRDLVTDLQRALARGGVSMDTAPKKQVLFNEGSNREIERGGDRAGDAPPPPPPPESQQAVLEMDLELAENRRSSVSSNKPKPQPAANKRTSKRMAGSVFERLANPANFPAANPMGQASREGKKQSELSREEQRRKRDQPVQLKSSFTGCGQLSGHGGAVYCVTTVQGSIYTSSQDTTVKMWDGKSLSLLCTLEGHTGIVRTVAWNDHGFLVSGSLDRTIRLWDVRQNKCVHVLRHKSLAELCKVLPSGNGFFSASEDSAIRLWDARKMDARHPPVCTHTLQGHSSSVFALLKTPDFLFSGSRDHTLKVWNGSTLRMQQNLAFHYDSVTALLWLRGCLVSASRDRSIKLFNEGLDQDPFSIDSTSYPNNAHTDYILDLEKSLDESVMLSACKDGTVKLWDADNLACGGTLKLHRSAVHSLAWLNGDQYLLTASQDRTVRILRHSFHE